MNAHRLIRRKRLPRVLAAIALLTTTLIVPLTQHPALAQDTASIRFAFWGDPAEEAAYQVVVDAF
jgi:hypothetical protein